MNGVVSAFGVGVADGSGGWLYAQIEESPRATTKTNDFPQHICTISARLYQNAPREQDSR
jgi:hypothetical protein